MSVELLEQEATKVLAIVEIQVTGKLTKEDYRRFVPRIDGMIRLHGKVRILFDMVDFHGWKAGALWVFYPRSRECRYNWVQIAAVSHAELAQ
jgi:hypothetical protein